MVAACFPATILLIMNFQGHVLDVANNVGPPVMAQTPNSLTPTNSQKVSSVYIYLILSYPKFQPNLGSFILEGIRYILTPILCHSSGTLSYFRQGTTKSPQHSATNPLSTFLMLVLRTGALPSSLRLRQMRDFPTLLLIASIIPRDSKYPLSHSM